METKFPLPEVARALEPFIKTRQEVQAVRAGLQLDFPLTPVDLAHPKLASEKLTDPARLTGVRKAYWKALQAHEEAQARYDALKAELTQASAASHGPESGNVGLLANSYIPLLRQREKQRRLEIIQRAYTKINAAGGATIGESFDSTAMLGIGELPTPPTMAFADRDMVPDADEHCVKLKKAVLAAQRQIEEHRVTIAHAGDIAAVAKNPHAELSALQSAHSELTLWMEDQLAMIGNVGGPSGEDDAAGATSSPTPPSDATHKHVHVTAREIESLYDQYLDARNRLLDTIETPPPTKLQAVSMAYQPGSGSGSGGGGRGGNEAENGNGGGGDMEQQSRLTASEAVLPFVAPLLATKRLENGLLQQSAYVRRVVAHAEAHTSRIVARLADESHLVPPGASRGRDWAQAAGEAGASTVEFATARIQAGNEWARTAARALATMHELPASLDALSLPAGEK